MRDRFGQPLEVGDYVAHATVRSGGVCLTPRQVIGIFQSESEVGFLHLDGSTRPGRVMPHNVVKTFNQY